MTDINKIEIDEIKRRLASRYNIEEDELKTLGYDSEAKIREYYANVALQSKNLELTEEDESEKGKIPVDAYKLEKKYQEILEKKKKLRKKKEQVIKKMDYEIRSAPQDHLKPEERVSFEDAQKAVAALKMKPVRAKNNKKKK